MGSALLYYLIQKTPGKTNSWFVLTPLCLMPMFLTYNVVTFTCFLKYVQSQIFCFYLFLPALSFFIFFFYCTFCDIHMYQSTVYIRQWPDSPALFIPIFFLSLRSLSDAPANCPSTSKLYVMHLLAIFSWCMSCLTCMFAIWSGGGAPGALDAVITDARSKNS